MTLDVVIGTYKPAGIERLSQIQLPVVEDVKYIISWQAHEDYPVPEKLIRPDIRIFRLDGVGLSRNRNNAISHSDAEIIYIADDDIEILPGALDQIKRRFEEYPDTDMATFKMKEGRNRYPKDITDLGFYLPKNYNVASCQIAFRRKIFETIRFNERFGINSGVFEVGEDELFHLQARKKGFICRFFPDIIASHPHESTGSKKISDPRAVEGFGFLITKSYPRSFLLRLPLKAYRMKAQGQYGFFKGWYHLIMGSLKSFREKI